MTTAAVVLAAGGGSRFEGPTHKLLAPLRGRRVVDWAVDAACDSGLDEVIVVVGAVTIDGLPADVTMVTNPDWAEGQVTSLRAAVAHARAQGHGAIVVGLGDQPLIESEAWRRVAAASSSPVAVATYDGQRRHPVRLASEVWAHLPSSGDAGGRTLMAAEPDQVVEIPCPGTPIDIDTVEDLKAWS